MAEPHKYPYAINEDGNPIYIDDITKENRKQTRFFCYGCGAELFPVLGEVKEHHFRHAKDAICDPNKYLHEFAKAAIKKRFDEKNTFIVKYKATHICEKYGNCELAQHYHWEECKYDDLYSIDLKQYYDTCLLERGYYEVLPDGKKKYIADLKLSDSKDDNKKPVIIEIWVTHECTDDKKQNGGKIIEIKINCEKDASRPIIQSDDESLPIRFFNFKNPIQIEPSRKLKHVKLMPSLFGKVIVTDETPCSEGLQYDAKGENEVIYSDINLAPDVLHRLYTIECCEKGLSKTHDLCKNHIYGQNRITNQISLYCSKECPCGKYIFDSKKAEELKNKFLHDNNVVYWKQND